jgi:cytoskeletal protein CcmA (bactofilin family)
MSSNPKDFSGVIPVNSKAASVSQGIRIKGELTGSEDLFIDGQVEGSITLTNSTVTIGPNATVKAEINAHEVVVRGKVDGKITGTEKIQVWSSARIHGDLKAERIAVEEGAELHGTLEVGKPSAAAADLSRGANAKRPDAAKAKDAGAGAAVAGVI